MLEGQIKCSDHVTCDTRVVVRSMRKTEGFFCWFGFCLFFFFFGPPPLTGQLSLARF